MATKVSLLLVTIFSLFLGYRVLQLESALDQLQTNTAIAVLSAEAANDKIGAFAPYFSPDKDRFARAWIDNLNLPPAMFPEEVIVPLKQKLEQNRNLPGMVSLRESTFK